MISNTQNSVITNTGKDLKILKNRSNRYGGQVGSCTSEKNISTVWNVGQFDIAVWMWDLTCLTFRKFEIFGQVGCRICDMGPYKWLYKRL